MASQMERIPPHNLDAEKSVLGAILMDKDVFFDVSEVLTADDFYAQAHKEIYSAMQDLFQRGESVDIITVTENLNRRGTLEAVGGRVYVALLSSEVPTTANAVQYARIIAEKAMLRRLISAAGGMVEEAFGESLSSQQVLDHAEQTILDIAKTRQTGDFTRISEVMSRNIDAIHEAEANKGQVPGLPTGFRDLDAKTNGLQKSDLIIIAARPSMGKTAFALNIAQYAAVRKKKRVAIFSLEMSDDSLGMRLLSMEARVDSKKLKTGDLSVEEWESLEAAAQKLSDSDIMIDDTTNMGAMEIRNKCRRMVMSKPLDLIVIDYLQMMSADTRAESRQQEVTQISRYLKQLAREMECPVIVLSQLSRAAEKRQGDSRPMLSDLRESGAIEQDADVVMFLYRPDYYKAPDAQPTNTCEVIIAKQRNGETGTVTLTWVPRYTKFADRSFETPEANYQ